MRNQIFILFILILSSAIVLANPADSVGVEKRDGKVIVLHQVEQGETLFSLSRRYGTSVEDIKAANPDMEVLKIGETIRIPLPENQDPTAVTHRVKASETLYSISRQYGVSVDEILHWNSLKDPQLSIGQVLSIYPSSESTSQTSSANLDGKRTHTVASGETLYSISRQYEVSIEDLRKWNQLEGNALDLGQVIIVGELQNESGGTAGQTDTGAVVTEESVTVIPATTQTPKTGPEEVKFDKVVENGLAEVIEGTENTRKYLALHKTAEIGTIMQVKNEMNGLSVFVRVLGKLPDTPENTMLILKLSEKAYQKLGAVDKRFRVELVYSP